MKKQQSDYVEKLKDPRWQKKRLEIFERDGWKCRWCKSANNTLTVHHCYYDFSLEPWEYSNDSLVTLCLYCHEKEQANYREVIQFLKEEMGKRGWVSGNIFQLSEAIKNGEIKNGKPSTGKRARRHS